MSRAPRPPNSIALGFTRMYALLLVAHGAKSKVRSAVEHVFAHQKGPMALVVRTIGLARATVKIGLANIVYNMRRAVWMAHQMTPT